MKAQESECNSLVSSTNIHSSNHLPRNRRAAKYQKVRDGRKQPIRGLWIRNNRYYAQLTVEDPNTGAKSVRRIPLVDSKTKGPVSSVAQAVSEMQRLKTQRVDNELPVLKRTPKFSDYVSGYLAHFQKVKDAKRPATLAKEKSTLELWKAHLGDVRLDQIRRVHINSFIAKRQEQGMSARTANLDVIALRNVLKSALEDGWIKSLPTANMRPLKTATKKRSLITMEQIHAICRAAGEKDENGAVVSRNARQFADYIYLMAYCGSRRNETLRLKWSDVDWDRKQLTVGADGLAKNHECRVVDFNPKLEAHLQELHGRRAPDSEWIFPSPQRGEKDVPAKTFMESLRLARKQAKLPQFGFHDCRHFFISFCVMSGIDYMTIARWVGHKDGGVLIGKVYGHLSNEHAQRQASKLVFESNLEANAK